MEENTQKKSYPKNLGSMNQMTKDGKAIIASQGHSKNSFKRNYGVGTANYTCKHCGADLQVDVNSVEGIKGSVLSKRCLSAEEKNINNSLDLSTKQIASANELEKFKLAAESQNA